MCKYEMDLTSIIEDTERTRFCPQMDRRGVEIMDTDDLATQGIPRTFLFQHQKD